MTQPLTRRHVVLCLAAILVCPLGMAAPTASQDAWAKVPPMPTGCYLEPENFPEKLDAAQESITADRDRQKKINDELSEKLKQLDPMEQANRMQEYMMAHPEEAMKLMQQNAALGETYADELTKNYANLEKLEAELVDLEARYNAAVDKALAPVKAKLADLDVRAQKDLVVVGEGYAYAPWAVKEFDALTAQSNKAYETTCAEWWGASGQFHGWMNRHKQNLVERIPKQEEADVLGVGFMVALVGTPTNSFKSTATMEAALEHIRKAINVFDKRARRPDPPYEGH